MFLRLLLLLSKYLENTQTYRNKGLVTGTVRFTVIKSIFVFQAL